MRRKYKPGICGDCGRHKNVTQIVFWLNHYTMNACADCIKPYRKRILKPISQRDEKANAALLAACAERS